VPRRTTLLTTSAVNGCSLSIMAAACRPCAAKRYAVEECGEPAGKNFRKSVHQLLITDHKPLRFATPSKQSAINNADRKTGFCELQDGTRCAHLHLGTVEVA